MGAMQSMGNPGGQNHDALYVGDLQWVRVVCCLLMKCMLNCWIVCLSVCFLTCSGRRMRICVRWL
jgi:hypothetical protein